MAKPPARRPSTEKDSAPEALRKVLQYNRLLTYLPYGHPLSFWDGGRNPHCLRQWSNKPWQYEFHEAGKNNPERMIMAANRVGKTQCGAAEVAMHLTGIYPPWWPGFRFSHAILAWCGSVTNEASRDIVQKELLGAPTGPELGTGFIPRACFQSPPRPKQVGLSGVIDYAEVMHVTGEISRVVFKSYDQGQRKWQGTAPHVVWMDEEPAEDSSNETGIYSEALTRILSVHGLIMVTYTPLIGETRLTKHFMYPPASGIYMVNAGWDDAPHLDPKERERLKASYPEHEVLARTQGLPTVGHGAVFPVAQADYVIEPIEIPNHWARIAGIDFGIDRDHPHATVWTAHDRDADIIYVYDCARKAGETAVYHVAALNARGRWIPVAWPHDGMSREKSGGTTLADAYADIGANMLRLSARYKNEQGGGQEQEPIVMEVLERMKTGRLRIFRNCFALLEELRSYHRVNGRIVSRRDDTIKAMMYAVMMRRFATIEAPPEVERAYRRPVFG